MKSLVGVKTVSSHVFSQTLILTDLSFLPNCPVYSTSQYPGKKKKKTAEIHGVEDLSHDDDG